MQSACGAKSARSSQQLSKCHARNLRLGNPAPGKLELHGCTAPAESGLQYCLQLGCLCVVLPFSLAPFLTCNRRGKHHHQSPLVYLLVEARPGAKEAIIIVKGRGSGLCAEARGGLCELTQRARKSEPPVYISTARARKGFFFVLSDSCPFRLLHEPRRESESHTVGKEPSYGSDVLLLPRSFAGAWPLLDSLCSCSRWCIWAGL